MKSVIHLSKPLTLKIVLIPPKSSAYVAKCVLSISGTGGNVWVGGTFYNLMCRAEREERERAERAKREEELREYQERVKKLEEVERKKRQRELEIEERERRREEERRLGDDSLSRKVSTNVSVT